MNRVKIAPDNGPPMVLVNVTKTEKHPGGALTLTIDVHVVPVR